MAGWGCEVSERRGKERSITVGARVAVTADTVVSPGRSVDARAAVTTKTLLPDLAAAAAAAAATATAAAAGRGDAGALRYQRLAVTTCVLRSTSTRTCSLLHAHTHTPRQLRLCPHYHINARHTRRLCSPWQAVAGQVCGLSASEVLSIQNCRCCAAKPLRPSSL